MSERVFGSIPGVPVGKIYNNRLELSHAGVHRPPQAEACGTGAHGAESIVLSGGYEDDIDSGDIIIYTGQGGNDPFTKTQIADQELTRGNLALAVSEHKGNPVRVVRRVGGKFQYGGLYRVVDHWSEKGRAGFLIWRFKLVRIEGR